MVSLYYFKALLALGVIATVNAGPDTGNWGKACRNNYDGGATFTGQALSDLNRACYGWPGNQGFYQDARILDADRKHRVSNFLQMYFKPWNDSPYTAQLCVNQPGNTLLRIEIGNLNPSVGFTLRPDDCYKELKALTFSPFGGEEQQYGWFFRVDPNDGQC